MQLFNPRGVDNLAWPTMCLTSGVFLSTAPCACAAWRHVSFFDPLGADADFFPDAPESHTRPAAMVSECFLAWIRKFGRGSAASSRQMVAEERANGE